MKDPSTESGSADSGHAVSEWITRINDVIERLAESEAHLSLSSVASQLHESLEEGDPFREMILAFEFNLIVDAEASSAQEFGPFGPRFQGTTEDGEAVQHPPRLEELRSEISEKWAACVDPTLHAVPRARFADLLWNLRYGEKPHEWGLRAIDSYVESARIGWDSAIFIRDGLLRAFDIAQRLNQPQALMDIERAALDLVSESLEDDARAPGLVVPLLDAVLGLGTVEVKDEANELLDDAARVYADDPWTMRSLLDLRIRAAPPDEREQLRENQVEGFIRFAEAGDSTHRYAQLTTAAELAAANGLTETHDKIVKEIESMSADEIGLTSLSHSIEIDQRHFDDWVEEYIGDDSFEAAIDRYGSSIPTEKVEDNRREVDDLAEAHPLQRLITRTVLGDFNAVLKRAETPEEQHELDLARHEEMKARFFGRMLGVGFIDGAATKYEPSQSEIEALFTTEVIEPVVAEAIARSFVLYRAGDPDAACAVLAPRLERVIRRGCHLMGLQITKGPSPRGGQPGGVHGLGRLLADLRGAMNESQRRYLRCVLVEVAAINLRNRIGHGLIDRAQEPDYALLFHIACQLRLASVGPLAS